MIYEAHKLISALKALVPTMACKALVGIAYLMAPYENSILKPGLRFVEYWFLISPIM